ncbi:ribonuclease HII [Bathymodiolus platifrons methanotrophic gill symbiont]|uniref:ribonuclease HII n=1 Tax=Bathymodiolus platifrons methanotrophic gill symbiont TaxID=113268 RepID=UPI0011C6EFE5|nr:ribonuclease HII [Bathymodiolus platifrons methanotrophic gill symbiont]MCK5869358.1 ribonuclease HII [Methyloprofundus sp.]TXK95726.1 ribonuclease HII [Methylococcaceae bacterium CS4]TXK96944.1 ribonuclease HII [Methylococcaceae bacterium CS5]TXK99775.1 ribonuclease HII [Methylococcaceae bacterium HT1]TXL03844.1 ribonuclease HII [Methylococcaceae bacterium CS1]TXL05129.1 ribonuclease HII [Methylococcaceae bacterium CS3]TXL10091.1 ribonuclease HII [Methylococcaceae bacterium CS2]TXL13557
MPHSQIIAGVDEVGRGCIVGPVIAAAVILDPERPITGLTDSKKLTERKREQLSSLIKQQSIAWAIGRAEASEIDQINILQASLLAMQRAVNSLSVQPSWLKVDGNQYPDSECPGETIIQGDLLVAEISAASIIAKVYRDGEMAILDSLYSGYEFSRHKGYPTKLHKEKLTELGVSEQHRRTFAPVKLML